VRALAATDRQRWAHEITRDYKDLERARWQRLAEIHHARAGLVGNIRNAVP